jgi:hypothetical protein
VMTESGKLNEEVQEILAVAARSNIPVSTRHLSLVEALALAEEAKSIGKVRHVSGHSISRATHEEIRKT